jgi:hypothetical protein
MKAAAVCCCCCASGGDAHLGGDDWDAAVVNWLRENYLEPAGTFVQSAYRCTGLECSLLNLHAYMPLMLLLTSS